MKNFDPELTAYFVRIAFDDTRINKLDRLYEVFQDKEPINARNRAFKYLNDELKYFRENNAESGPFIDEDAAEPLKKGNIIYSYTVEWYNPDDKVEYESWDFDVSSDIDQETIMFPPIAGNYLGIYSISDIIDSLSKEYAYYLRHHFKIDRTKIINNQIAIIYTDLDWENELTPNKYDEAANLIKNGVFKSELLVELINLGENNRIEFKQEYSDTIIKAASAFLNSLGGFIIIGVSDKRTITGLGGMTADRLLRQIDNKVEQCIGPSVFSSYIHSATTEIGGMTILILLISKSDEPVFTKYGLEHNFYIRRLASNTPLEIKEAWDWILRNWNYKKIP